MLESALQESISFPGAGMRRLHQSLPPTLIVALLSIIGCERLSNDPVVAPISTDPPLFRDITEAAGVAFVHQAGTTGRYFMPEMTPPGVALFDYDRDGDLDLYLVNSGDLDDRGLPRDGKTGVQNRLYRQDDEGRFVDVTASSGLGDAGYGMGAAVGDIDNDGFPDVYLSNLGADHLYRNNQDGTFSDVTLAAGIDNIHWTTSVSLLDFDRDGWLDLYVTNYVDYHADVKCPDNSGRDDYCGPQVFSGLPDKLYRNLGGALDDAAEGTGPRFEDVSLAAGIARQGGPGLGVVCADFNDDRWPDIYVANDHAANFLWINQQDGTFQDEALFRGGAVSAQGRPQASMGIAVGDVDGNGRIDLLLTHLEGENNSLYLGVDKKGFRESSARMGLASPSLGFTGFGTAFLDIENDGDLDLVVANGRVKRATRRDVDRPGPDVPGFWRVYAEANHVFLNDGTGKFRRYRSAADPFSSAVEVSRGLATGDIDNDGDLDMVVTNTAGPARVYRNEAPLAGHWLIVQAILPDRGGRNALGARVTLVGKQQTWTRMIQSATSYLSASDSRAHFGLGETDQVLRIEVDWPDGRRETFDGGQVDVVRVLQAGEGES